MNEDNLPLPQGPWGLPGIGGRAHSEPTQTPPDKKKQQNRRREKQAKASRKANRRK